MNPFSNRFGYLNHKHDNMFQQTHLYEHLSMPISVPPYNLLILHCG